MSQQPKTKITPGKKANAINNNNTIFQMRLSNDTIFPFPIQTNKGVVHLYYKDQLPIIGTMMTKSRGAVIVVTETKKYCCFLSEISHIMKKYVQYRSYFFYEDATKRELTEDILIQTPCECMKPFNLNTDFINHVVYLDFVSLPEFSQYKYDFHNQNTVEVNDTSNDIIPIKDLTITFQLKLYEYDNHNQSTDVIDSNSFVNNPKLEMMLKKIWKIEQGIETFPPIPTHEIHDTNTIENSIIIIPFDTLITTEEKADHFLNNNYHTNEYKKYTIDKTSTSIKDKINGFLNTRSKKLLFNLHYTNQINKLQFISVYEYNATASRDSIKTYPIDNEGLGFCTTQTNKIFSYQKYDKTIHTNTTFNKLFVFHLQRNRQNILSNDEDDLFTTLNNGPYIHYFLRIIQTK